MLSSKPATINHYIRLIICILFFLGLIFTIDLIQPISAADDEPTVKFIPQVTIPNSGFTAGQEKGVGGNTIGEYIRGIYNYAVGIVGIVAAVAIMWGGFLWLTSAGNASRVDTAKSYIISAISGLVLVLGSYFILYTINPQLTLFRSIDARGPGYDFRCTTKSDPGDLCATEMSEESGKCKPMNGNIDCRDGCMCDPQFEGYDKHSDCNTKGLGQNCYYTKTNSAGICVLTINRTALVCQPRGCCKIGDTCRNTSDYDCSKDPNTGKVSWDPRYICDSKSNVCIYNQ